MKLGMIGLGKTGGNVTTRLLHGGHTVVVSDSGMGRCTVKEAVDLAVPVPVIALALHMRFRSQEDAPCSGQLLAALRQQFGGHPVKPRDAT